MSWLALVTIVTATGLPFSSSSFLSAINEYKRIDSGSAPLKRHGVPPILVTDMPMPEDSEGAGGRPSFGADEGWGQWGTEGEGVEEGSEEGDLDCDAIMRQCQCDGGGGGGGDEVKGALPTKKQRKTLGFDIPSEGNDPPDYPMRPEVTKRRRHQGK